MEIGLHYEGQIVVFQIKRRAREKVIPGATNLVENAWTLLGIQLAITILIDRRFLSILNGFPKIFDKRAPHGSIIYLFQIWLFFLKRLFE